MSKDDDRPLYRALEVSSVGIELALSIVLGWLGGSWLDDMAGTAPWLTVTGVLFGVTAGFYALYRVAQKVARRQRQGSGDP